MDTAVDEEQAIDHVTDLQEPQTDAEASVSSVAGAEQNGDVSPPQLDASDEAPPVVEGCSGAASGLATSPATKRRRYRSLFGNIGKLITFNRRKQEQPASPGSASNADHLAEGVLQFPTNDTASLDLIVPDAEISGLSAAEDPISVEVPELEILESPEISPPLAEETSVESSGAVKDAETAEAAQVWEKDKEAVESAEPLEQAGAASRDQIVDEKKKKMDYDMSMGSISTILEETEEAVKAQEGELLSEADLIKLESEIDLADYSSQKKPEEMRIETVDELKVGEKGQNQDGQGQQEDLDEENRHDQEKPCARAEKAAEDLKQEPEVKDSRLVALQNQISESDSGYGCSTSESPVEAEAEKSEKPQPPAEEVAGSSGGSDVFDKESHQSAQSSKLAVQSEALISPSDEELASFEKAEVCVEDSMVDLVDINVKLDSLIESNSPDKASRTSDQPEEDEPPVVEPEFDQVPESHEDDEDDEMEPVELDLSSNQSVRRRQFMEAKARRQKELDAARKQQEEAFAGAVPIVETAKADSPELQSAVRDKDIVDKLGPRRHSHENNACAEGSEGGRSRMRSRLPVRRSASCPRRAVQDYSTYIRSGAGAKKPIAQLVESSYSPVKIDFKPLTHAARETHGEQLTPGSQKQQQQQQQQQKHSTSGEPRPGQVVGQASKRAGKKVHFNSPTADKVVTYSTAAEDCGDEMKHRDGGENGQHQQTKTRQTTLGSGARMARHKVGEAEKPGTQQQDRSLIKSISVKQTLASRKRLEKQHDDAVKQLGLQDESQYMTPLQRKDLEVKELKRQLDEAYFVVEQRELELDVFHHEKAKSIDDAVKDRDEKIGCLQVQIGQLERDFASLRAQHSDMCRREKSLAETLDQLRAECAEKERRHQDLYLEMYRKGRDSARFERQDEIEKLAVLEPDKVAMEELLEKLEITQHDLQKWQSIKLKEVYEDSDKNATESDAKLRFLRDSMFHYLTDKDKEQNKQHLMAMIGIFSFTDVQMKHIMKSLDDRRKKGKI